MNGILLINKPKDYTSHDIVNIVRRALKTKKVGHTGTLDPDATGLLVLGINNGTKIIKHLNNDTKEYIATVCVGKTTDTLDRTGEVISESEVVELVNTNEIVKSFEGLYTQTPPMYSAIKYKGKRLYEYARKGITIDDIPSRDITIFDINQISDIIYKDNCATFMYQVFASKGLYVRTLSYDIAAKLGYPGYNETLHRTKAGVFRIEDAYTLEELEKGEFKLISLSDSLDMQTVTIQDDFRKHIKNGMAISLRYFKKPVLTKIVDEENNLLAIYDKHPSEPKMKAINIFHKE